MWRKRFKKPGPKRLERTRGAAFPYFLLPSIGCLLALLACASAGYRSPRKGGGEAIASHTDERGGGRGRVTILFLSPIYIRRSKIAADSTGCIMHDESFVFC